MMAGFALLLLLQLNSNQPFYPNGTYKPGVVTPEKALGYQIGERFTRYDQLEKYYRALAQSTDRMRMEPYGETYEGRTNHYYFDLNRDWAWQTQKESKARIKSYLRWNPQVFVDYHEMGSVLRLLQDGDRTGSDRQSETVLPAAGQGHGPLARTGRDAGKPGH